jgi:putative ABC transport system permease protein
MEMFVLSGVFIVSSAVLLFLFNSTQILGVIVKLYGLTGRPTATLKTATAYPMKSKFRTGMTLYMFALVIFTITVMSMMVGMISYNIDKTISEQAGGIDIVGLGNANRPIFNMTAEIEASDNLTMDDFNAVMGLSYGFVMRNTTIENPRTGSMNTYQTIMGMDEQFMLHNKFVMDKMDERYKDEREVWRAVWDNPEYAVIDGGLAAGQSMMMGGGEDSGGGMSGVLGPVKKYGIGDNVTLYTPAGVVVNKTVIGIMVQSMLGGVYMSSEAATRDFNLTVPTFFFFDVKDGRDYEKLGKTMEKELHLEIIVVSVLVKQFTNIMDQFFNLFSAFMGLGLIVGIAGLGIITLRAVHERRLEIGMMRAIGFKKRGVIGAFFMEASFIALMGIFIGTLLGIALGFNIWYDGFRPENFDFYIAWPRIIVVTLIAYGATAALTIVPAFMASKIAPAEALRFE